MGQPRAVPSEHVAPGDHGAPPPLTLVDRARMTFFIKNDVLMTFYTLLLCLAGGSVAVGKREAAERGNNYFLNASLMFSPACFRSALTRSPLPSAWSLSLSVASPTPLSPCPQPSRPRSRSCLRRSSSAPFFEYRLDESPTIGPDHSRGQGVGRFSAMRRFAQALVLGRALNNRGMRRPGREQHSGRFVKGCASLFRGVTLTFRHRMVPPRVRPMRRLLSRLSHERPRMMSTYPSEFVPDGP